ncbi:MAG: circadian clock protein KaiC [Leptospiraceae bacterium]|nr:circadian clock protein KaiC [Leptospiraceae bacterium]
MIIKKIQTGIKGLDEVLHGGIPQGRITMLKGSAGTGKTLLAIEILLKSAMLDKEPGVYISFENTVNQIMEDISSFGWNLSSPEMQKLLKIDYFGINDYESYSEGEISINVLGERVEHLLKKTNATKLVFDTLESLWDVVGDSKSFRWQFRNFLRRFTQQDITLIITSEQINGQSKYPFDEFVSDCVIHLEQNIISEIVTRKLRIIKYRGTTHGLNAYPYIISESGNYVYPITSLGLTHTASYDKISTGIPDLDVMLHGGIFRGSSVLISGTSGCGKSSIAGFFANQTCKTGEKCIYFAFEESEAQIFRNYNSIGINLEQWKDKGLLNIHATRSSTIGLEHHLLFMFQLIEKFQPQLVILDPVSNFISPDNGESVKSFLVRMIDHLKDNNITCLFTSLIRGSGHLEETDESVSSLMDTWISLQMIEQNNERNRVLKILKSRGMAHSNQLREFILSSSGIHLMDVYIGAEGMVTGSKRLIQQAQENAERKRLIEEIELLKRKQQFLEKQFHSETEIKKENFENTKSELQKAVEEAELRLKTKDLSMQDVEQKRKI